MTQVPMLLVHGKGHECYPIFGLNIRPLEQGIIDGYIIDIMTGDEKHENQYDLNGVTNFKIMINRT